jgi:ribose transport system permease protein
MTTHADPPPRRRVVRLAGLADMAGMLAVLLGLIVLFGLLSRSVLTGATLRSVLNQNADLMVVAVGMTFVLIVGGIDLSVGSVLGLSGSVLGLALVGWGLPLPLALAVSLGVGLGCGLLNGLIGVAWALPSFIVTLGMLEMARGGAYLASGSLTAYVGGGLEWVSRPIGSLGGVSPALLIALGVVIAGQVVLSRTVFGRKLVAIGTNEAAVRLCGIDPRGPRVAAFALSGLLAALGAVFQTSRLSVADPNAGVGLELSAIAAAVIGGTSLMGGRGSVVRTFLGVLIIAVLQTGLMQVGAKEPTKRLITGAVIIAAVVIDQQRAGWSARLRGRRSRGG